MKPTYVHIYSLDAYEGFILPFCFHYIISIGFTYFDCFIDSFRNRSLFMN